MRALVLATCSMALAGVLATGGASAAPASAGDAGPAGAAPLHDEATFRAFHGRAGIERIVDDLLRRSRTDPRIADVFRTTDFAHLRSELSDQICYLLDGPCGYTGKDMKAAHKDMGLQDADLNALVEDLQAAMDAEHVPFRAQNRLLAKLAPMRRLVVER